MDNRKTIYIAPEILALVIKNERGLSASIAETVKEYRRLEKRYGIKARDGFTEETNGTK